jgi:hypothetical protein
MTTWLLPEQVAPLMGVSPRHVRRLAKNGKLVSRREPRGRNANAVSISETSLPPAARAKLLGGQASELAPVVQLEADQAGRSYSDAPASVRQRAELRLEAVHGLAQAIPSRGEQRISDVERAFVATFHREHPAMKISVKSLRRWSEAFRAGGIDALVDGNDGSARRGHFNIPPDAQRHFFTTYLDATRNLTVKAAILETRAEGLKRGWKLPRRDDPFYRYARSIDSLAKALRKTSVDSPETVLDSVLRGQEQPYRTLQSDHHIVDVFVSCEGAVCGEGRCQAGHRPWWTPMMDVGSRKIISYQISLDVPNSTRILDAFRLAVEREGLPERFYVDNGKDFRKATGKAKYKLSPDEQTFLDNRFRALGVSVTWAKPYNAQAKAIERLFKTFVDQHWRSFESYVGALGERSEHADHLYRHPELLPTFAQFCAELALRVELYNSTPHRGVGMSGRTPAEAFAQQRIARRDPDPAAFALVFWQCETRVLDRHGLRVAGRLYRLEDPDGSVASRYYKQQVRILIDPQDLSRAIVCSIDERFLCPAVERELATHDFGDAVTQREHERVQRHNKTLRRRANAGDDVARRQLEMLKRPPARLAALRMLVAERRGNEAQIATATGTEAASTVVVPSFSRIARDVAAAFESRPSLSPAEHALAASVPAISDEQLDRLLDAERGYTPAPRHLRAVEEEIDVAAELARVARLRKEKDGLCLVDGCEEVRTRVMADADECGRHWLAIHGNELAKELGAIWLEGLRRQIEEEVRG